MWDYMINMGPHYHRFRVLNNLYSENVLGELFEQHEKIVNNLVEGKVREIDELYEHHIFGGLENFSPIIKKYPNYFSEIET